MRVTRFDGRSSTASREVKADERRRFKEPENGVSARGRERRLETGAFGRRGLTNST